MDGSEHAEMIKHEMRLQPGEMITHFDRPADEPGGCLRWLFTVAVYSGGVFTLATTLQVDLSGALEFALELGFRNAHF